MGDTNPTTFVTTKINHDAATFPCNQRHRGLQLRATITTSAGKYIARETFTMNANKNGTSILNIAHRKSQMLGVINIATKCSTCEVSPIGGNLGLTHAGHQLLVVSAVLDEFGDTRQQQVVFSTKLNELRQARH